MEDQKIKTAREIAMEKIAKISKLTPEEVMEQKEREYKTRGGALAEMYLENTLVEPDYYLSCLRIFMPRLWLYPVAILLR